MPPYRKILHAKAIHLPSKNPARLGAPRSENIDIQALGSATKNTRHKKEP
jgi:hypothetical protein